METILIITGAILLLIRIAGSILPILPGPPLCFVALLIQQFREVPTYSTNFLIIWAVIAVSVSLLDYVIPMYGTKRFGGSKYGMWGCTIGLIVGLFFSPVGIVLGPFIGAFIGEILANNNSSNALRAALGSFLGFLLGTLLKFVVCVMMAWYFIAPLID
jgi:uncharacterized protein YqgC (DUF456 family)